MKVIRISVPHDADFSRIIGIIEETVISGGLQITLKATLGKYPGSTHWHIKNAMEKGILEITLWPKHHRAWFSIQNGRQAEWIQPKITVLKRQFATRLRPARALKR